MLLLILMSNKFSRFLGEAANGSLPKDTVFELLGYSSINYLIILIPIGLFIAVLLSLGRLYQDSEMSAMHACGIGPWQVFRPVLFLAIIAAAGLYWLSMEVAPWAAKQVLQIRNTALEEVQLTQLEPGQFLTADEGNVVFYAESKNLSGQLEKVFLQQSTKNKNQDKAETQNDSKQTQQIVTAKIGYQEETTLREQKLFVLKDGVRYQGIPGQRDYEKVRFAEHGIPIRTKSSKQYELGVEELPSRELDKSKLDHMAEWQWRWSIPISVLLLAFLALPMSKTNPRQGRFGKVAIAILLYVVYSNLLALSKTWIEKNELSSDVGVWWVHLLLVAITLFLLFQQYGFRGLFGLTPKKTINHGQATT